MCRSKTFPINVLILSMKDLCFSYQAMVMVGSISHTSIAYGMHYVVCIVISYGHIRWLNFICNIVPTWAPGFSFINTSLYLLEVNSVIKPWHKTKTKTKTKMFEWCMRPDHIHFYPSCVTLNLWCDMAGIINSYGKASHTNICHGPCMAHVVFI